MAYSGKYTIKEKTKYKGDPNKIVYRSLWERHVMKWCDENPNIKAWVSEEVVVPYTFSIDKKVHRYYVDFLIQFEDRTVLVEVKPKKETAVPKKVGKNRNQYISEASTYVKNQNKWEAATEFAKDRGWIFEVWTEEILQNMGIMKKKIKPLKPMKAFKKPINKRKT